jgi:hypothetical protein
LKKCRTQLLSIVGHWSKFKESAYFSLLTLILTSASLSSTQTVVKFLNGDLEGEEIEIIHLAWMAGEDSCFYPPYWKSKAQLKKGLLIGELPNKETWTFYRIKVLHSYGELRILSYSFKCIYTY